jgi:hypothetical protein
MHNELIRLCVSTNFVRNARIDLLVLQVNFDEVMTLLKANHYCVTAVKRNGGHYWMRAV